MISKTLSQQLYYYQMRSDQQLLKGSNLKNSNHKQKNKKRHKKKVSQWKRKEQPFLLFLLVNICEFYTSLQIYIFFKTTMNPNIPWNGVFGPIVGTSIFRIFVFAINSLYMGGLRTSFYAFTMLDILGVLSVCSCSVFVAFELIINIPMKQLTDSLPIATYMLIPLNTFFCVGSFRVMMMTCKWGKLNVIIYKLKLYACCFFFIAYGLLYEYYKTAPLTQCSPCDPLDASCQRSCTQVNDIVIYCCMDVDNLYKSGIDKINQFFVLFLAMSLAYTAELIAVMSDFDGMAELKGHFTLGLEENKEEKKKLLEVLNKINKDQSQEKEQIKKNDDIIQQVNKTLFIENYMQEL